jgi:hypothetical protein
MTLCPFACRRSTLHFLRTTLSLPAPHSKAAQQPVPPCAAPVPPDAAHAESYHTLCGAEHVAKLQLYD